MTRKGYLGQTVALATQATQTVQDAQIAENKAVAIAAAPAQVVTEIAKVPDSRWTAATLDQLATALDAADETVAPVTGAFDDAGGTFTVSGGGQPNVVIPLAVESTGNLVQQYTVSVNKTSGPGTVAAYPTTVNSNTPILIEASTGNEIVTSDIGDVVNGKVRIASVSANTTVNVTTQAIPVPAINSSNTVSGAGAPGGANPATTSVTEAGYYYQQLDAAKGANDIWGPSVAGSPATWPAQADNKSADPDVLSAAELQDGTDTGKYANAVELKAEMDRRDLLQQNKADLVTAIRDAATSEDTKYASEKAIRTALDALPTNFLANTDTMNSFAGLALQVLRVNAAEDAVEAIALAASLVAFDNTTSTLPGAPTEVQAAIDSLKGLIDALPDQSTVADFASLPGTADADSIVHVTDASGDPDIAAGWAKYQFIAGTWERFLSLEDLQTVAAFTDAQIQDRTDTTTAFVAGGKQLFDREQAIKGLVANLLSTDADFAVAKPWSAEELRKRFIARGDSITGVTNPTGNPFDLQTNTPEFEEYAIEGSAFLSNAPPTVNTLVGVTGTVTYNKLSGSGMTVRLHIHESAFAPHLNNTTWYSTTIDGTVWIQWDVDEGTFRGPADSIAQVTGLSGNTLPDGWTYYIRSIGRMVTYRAGNLDGEYGLDDGSNAGTWHVVSTRTYAKPDADYPLTALPYDMPTLIENSHATNSITLTYSGPGDYRVDGTTETVDTFQLAPSESAWAVRVSGGVRILTVGKEQTTSGVAYPADAASMEIGKENIFYLDTIPSLPASLPTATANSEIAVGLVQANSTDDEATKNAVLKTVRTWAAVDTGSGYVWIESDNTDINPNVTNEYYQEFTGIPATPTNGVFTPEESGVFVVEQILSDTNNQVFANVGTSAGASDTVDASSARLSSTTTFRTFEANLVAGTTYFITPLGGGGTTSGTFTVRIRRKQGLVAPSSTPALASHSLALTTPSGTINVDVFEGMEINTYTAPTNTKRFVEFGPFTDADAHATNCRGYVSQDGRIWVEATGTNPTLTLTEADIVAVGDKLFEDTILVNSHNRYVTIEQAGTYRITERRGDATNGNLVTYFRRRSDNTMIYSSLGSGAGDVVNPRIDNVNIENTGDVTLEANTQYLIDPASGGGTTTGSVVFSIQYLGP